LPADELGRSTSNLQETNKNRKNRMMKDKKEGFRSLALVMLGLSNDNREDLDSGDRNSWKQSFSTL
jgi:hypothetical protein